jgi:hypothetical protein
MFDEITFPKVESVDEDDEKADPFFKRYFILFMFLKKSAFLVLLVLLYEY